MSITKCCGIDMLDKDAIDAALAAVRSDTDPTNWFSLCYDPSRQACLQLHKKGSGGLAELSAEIAEPGFLGYAYLRVISGDLESRRTKFVFIVYQGTSAPLVRKARMGFDRRCVEQYVKHIHIAHMATGPEDLDEAELMAKVKKAGGADYDAGSNKNGYSSPLLNRQPQAAPTSSPLASPTSSPPPAPSASPSASPAPTPIVVPASSPDAVQDSAAEVVAPVPAEEQAPAPEVAA